MKVLIAYDDSECAKAALADLKNAGLPPGTEARVLMVTENWSLIMEEQEKELGVDLEAENPYADAVKQIRERARAAFGEVEKIVATVVENLKGEFPSWRVSGEAMPGFVHSGILEKARQWQPDLVVVGSHGRNLIGRIVMGSSSLKILTEAPCSVRVARCSPARAADDDSPQRIIVGFDGSPDSVRAVEAVAKRAWRQDSAARLTIAIEPMLVATPGFELDFEEVEKACLAAARRLEAAGLHVSTVRHLGSAKKVLVEEAEKWGADAVFVGARGRRLLERILLGSVSYSVAARAGCSVEVVR